MSKFTLEIECDNAAFTNEEGDPCATSAMQEVGRILEMIARKLRRTDQTGDDWAGILDGNGNRVGAWNYSH